MPDSGRFGLPVDDRYEILEEVGRGGSATVYLALDRKHGRRVALKVLRPDIASSENAERFLREIETAARLTHPHILPLHDSGQAGEQLYYVMPYVEGESLRTRLRDHGPLPTQDAGRIARDVARALAYAHGHGLVHRDIKPANILLVDGHAVVADFGLAKALEEVGAAPLTRTGVAVGTLAYMSPEQASGQPVDARTDVYALGCVLYEMLVGEAPHAASTPAAILARKLGPGAEPAALDEVEALGPFRAIVPRLLAVDPNERPADARELLRELEEIAGVGVSDPAGGLAARAATAGSNRGARGRGWIAAAAVAVAVAAYFGVLGRSGREVERTATFEQLTTSGNACSPSISPDGATVAFFGIHGERARLYVRDIAVGEAQEVFERPWEANGCPGPARWSPDGSRLLVRAAAYGIQIVSRFGGEPLLATPLVGQYPAWSADGSEIITVEQGGPDYRLIDVATLESTRIPFGESFEWFEGLDWSPAGERVVLVTRRGEVHTLWELSPETGAMREILTDSLELRSPRWDPAGESVYYLRTTGRTRELRRVPVGNAGDAPRPSETVRTGLSGGEFFTLSGDGEVLAYTLLVDRWELWQYDRPVHPDGAVEGRRLLSATTRLWEPTFSPDERHVAIVRGEPGEVVLVSLDDLSVREVTRFEAATLSPGWSPTGDALAVSVSVGPSARIWTIRADGTGRREYPATEVSQSSFKAIAWCDASLVVYAEPGNQDFAALRLETGEAATLIGGDETFNFLPVCSAARAELAFFRGQAARGLHVAGLDAPIPRLLVRGTVYPSSWSVDGEWINAIRIEDDLRGVPIRVSPDDGRVVPLLDAPVPIDGEVPWSHAAISRDGTRFVLPTRVSQSDVLLIRGFDGSR